MKLTYTKSYSSLNLIIEVEFNEETKEHQVISYNLYHGDKLWLYNNSFTEILKDEINEFTKDIDWYKIFLDEKYKFEIDFPNN